MGITCGLLSLRTRQFQVFVCGRRWQKRKNVANMENLGYKEGFAKTKKMPRKMSRALSVVGEDETAPLSMSRLVIQLILF